MPLGSRIFFSFIVFLVSIILLNIVGAMLNSWDIHGPLVDGDYLTDWAVWKYIAGLSAAVLALLSFWLFGRRKSEA
ncbi:MAG: hypothetical protein WBQ23_02340 [Bacteroidota bacterium]